jgi:hypothetical protein
MHSHAILASSILKNFFPGKAGKKRYTRAITRQEEAAK